ncbi:MULTISPECIES: hypothetical protein [Brevibacillus]|uniref:hypothetical protein n=1 Tax=Brevibacillus TaxID=55080 RepID=UPI0002A51CBC|nr:MULTISPECIES: hypothetical protein [Brevibacillus]ELK39504.1 hypothetical protein D478_24278 [Brevibacillus agri BAB-2500]MED3497189.1 hypothetical protein [Brevibacillus agri]MED4570626.1 hypothetical protein [Brevibacillus agri]QHZ56362.1 hypothetical protein M655_012245 [Brevibacillus sp. NSP2.1]
MNPQLKQLLLHFDDAAEWYAPKDFDYRKEMQQVKMVKARLEAETDNRFELDDCVQDASFFAEMYILEKSQHDAKASGGSYAMCYELAIRFSAFGRFVTIHGAFDETGKQPDLNRIIATLQENGYRYIPADELNTLYDGKNQAMIGEYTWWNRFFDYL